MDYKTMEILIMEKTNLYFGVILGVRIATFAWLRNTSEVLDTGRSLGSLHTNIHSLTRDTLAVHWKTSKNGLQKSRRSRDFFDPVEHASHSLALQNSLYFTHFSSLYDIHSLAQGGEAKKIICAPIKEHSPSGHKLALRVVTGGSQHFYGVSKVRPGHLGVPVLSLLIHIPALHPYSSPFRAPHTSLLKASSCLDEVLDSGVTKLVIDSLA